MKNEEECQKNTVWESDTKFSAHDVFDDLNDSKKAIECFYADECPKDESGMVLSLHDAELLAYEYARRLIEFQKRNATL